MVSHEGSRSVSLRNVETSVQEDLCTAVGVKELVQTQAALVYKLGCVIWELHNLSEALSTQSGSWGRDWCTAKNSCPDVPYILGRSGRSLCGWKQETFNEKFTLIRERE